MVYYSSVHVIVLFYLKNDLNISIKSIEVLLIIEKIIEIIVDNYRDYRYYRDFIYRLYTFKQPCSIDYMTV